MKAKPSIRRNCSGFTIIEVMVAFAIFMLIMGSVFACWRCILNGKVIVENAAAAAQRARIGIKTIEEALTSAEISNTGNNIQFYSFQSDTSDKFASLSLAARLPRDFPGSGLYGDIVMRRVAFDVENVDGVNNLVMYQSPLLEVINDQNDLYKITLARDVAIFMLEFWSVQDGDFVVSWDYTNQMPPMVRVTLGVGHPVGHPDVPYDVIVRTIAIPSQPH